jgi:hypothetical protein
MTTTQGEAPLLDEANAVFIQERVSVNVASRNADNIPSLTRALGCRVSPDRQRVTVFVSAAQSEALLRDLREHRAIAVVFSRPSTHQTLQLKGDDAVIGPLEAGDDAIVTAASASFVGELTRIGYTERYSQAVAAGLAAGPDAVSVTFTPTAAFDQTPGPGAGQRLRT